MGLITFFFYKHNHDAKNDFEEKVTLGWTMFKRKSEKVAKVLNSSAINNFSWLHVPTCLYLHGIPNVCLKENFGQESSEQRKG